MVVYEKSLVVDFFLSNLQMGLDPFLLLLSRSTTGAKGPVMRLAPMFL